MDRKNMSIPEQLKIQATNFPRTYRFVLTPEEHPELEHFVQMVKVKYYEKILEMSIYEMADGKTHDWILKLATTGYKENFSLKAYNGLGQEIYVLSFNGVQGIAHEVEYHYGKSDVVTHNLILDYETMNRKNRPIDPPAFEDPLSAPETPTTNLETIIKNI